MASTEWASVASPAAEIRADIEASERETDGLLEQILVEVGDGH
jgi:hypothetical protein